jgi:hypothetical protein
MLSVQFAQAAGLGQGTTPAGAAFASAAAGDQSFSGLGPPGDAVMGGISSQYINVQANTSSVGGTASASASNAGSSNGHTFTNSASATASIGTIRLSANNDGLAAVPFPGGAANAGWNDSFSLSGGGTNGTTGIWVVPIVVNGSMSATGNGASGLFQVAAYSNYNWLQPYGSAINAQAYNTFTALNTTHNGSDISTSWDYQMVGFGVVNYGPSDPSTVATLTVTNRVLNFAIPFTWGSSFEAGFYANLLAGERASGASTVQNQAGLDFSHTLTWGGPGYVIGAGGNITSFNIASISGFNYNIPSAVPEPETYVMMLAGLGLLGFVARLRRQKSAYSKYAAIPRQRDTQGEKVQSIMKRLLSLQMLTVETALRTLGIWPTCKVSLRRLNRCVTAGPRFFTATMALVVLATSGTAHALPDAVSYEYFGLNYAVNVATSSNVGVLNYTSGPGCGGVCTATTTLGSDPSVSLNVSEVTYQGAGGGYAEAELTYYVQYNNTPGNYAVNLNASDSLPVLANGSPAQAQAYLAFGLAVPPTSPPGTPHFQSYLVNETDCANGCSNGVANYLSPQPFPLVIPVVMAANTPYLVQMFVIIHPGTTGIQLSATVDPTFSTSALGGSFSFSPGITSAVPEPESYAMLLLGLGIMGIAFRRRTWQ